MEIQVELQESEKPVELRQFIIDKQIVENEIRTILVNFTNKYKNCDIELSGASCRRPFTDWKKGSHETVIKTKINF